MKHSGKFTVSGQIVDIVSQEIYPGTLAIEDGIIISVVKEPVDASQYIVPGLIDAHVHVESSMLMPSEFARAAVVHGTVATVSDPHEIANVLGLEGVNFMIQNGKKVPFKFYFGASSCVPATSFETSGAVFGAKETEELLSNPEIKYLSEMMNYPGVIFNDKDVLEKLLLAKKYNKPVDGHAPGLKGEEAKKYIEAGISTDHECYSIEEAKEKISYGMKIQIREGSAAKNFDELIPLIDEYPDMIMLCSDDKHPDDLMEGHINLLVKKAFKAGYDPIQVLRSTVYNPVKHYGLNVGMLQKGDPADFILVDSLEEFNIQKTFIDGKLVAESGSTLIRSFKETSPNVFNATQIEADDLKVAASGKTIRVQKALEGQLITEEIVADANMQDGNVISDTDNDVLKMVVLNRYENSTPAIDFVKGFG